MPAERRRFHRVPSVLPLRLFIRGGQHPIETLSKNLSLGGIKCLSPASQPVGTPVTIELGLGPSNDCLSLPATVSWFQTIPQSEQFFLGVTFDALSPQVTRLLSTDINHSASRVSATA
jgi:hypothetical protein